MPLKVHLKVRFGDVDQAGLVYYPRMFHYYHIALEEFFEQRCGITYERLMRLERIGYPAVNVSAEFLKPLLYGDEVEVEIFVSEVGRSSAVFNYSIKRTADRTLCARSKQVHVAMNLDSRQPVAITENYRRLFLATE